MNYLRAVIILTCLLPSAALAVMIDLRTVGDAGNPADGPPTFRGLAFGAVKYNYQIGTYDVTNAQYAEFLNAKAATNTLGLYNANMQNNVQGGISVAGSSGHFTYTVNPGFANKPVNYITWSDAVRFANWLNNGQGTGDTETGSYTLLGGTAIPTNESTVTRNPGARWVLPSENEWYKAAYYKGGSTNAGYWAYPFQSDSVPSAAAPPAGSNSGNFNNFVNSLTDVGAYTSALSPYGTFDMGGDLYQWSEGHFLATHVWRGGAWNDTASSSAAVNYGYDFNNPYHSFVGFRVALVPESGSFALLAIGAAGLLLWTSRWKNSSGKST